jgi:hypothetical protein
MIKVILILFLLVVIEGCREHRSPEIPKVFDVAICTSQTCTLYSNCTIISMDEDSEREVLIFVDDKGKRYESKEHWKILGDGGRIIFENPRFTIRVR